MSLSRYLIYMSSGTVIAWVAWFFVVANTNPQQADTLTFFFFYSSLFLAMAGTISVVGILVRRFVVRDGDTIFRHMRTIFRQSVLWSLLLVLVGVLQGSRLLSWWLLLIIIILASTLELVVFSNRHFNNKDYVR